MTLLSTAEDSSGAVEEVLEGLFFLDEVREEVLFEYSSSSSSEEVSVRPESLLEDVVLLLLLEDDEL